MIDIPVRIKVKESGADSAADSIDNLAGSGGTGGGGVLGLGEAFGSLTGGAGAGAAAGPIGAAIAAIGVGFVTGIGAAKAAIEVAIPAIISFGNEFERQAGIFNRTEGSVDQASDAIGGLVSNIDLMTSRNQLMQAGIHLSNQAFADVAEVAADFAAATGEETTVAMQRLGDALRTVSAEGLGQFGIVIDSTQTRAQQLNSALQQLSQRAAEMETGADTLGGTIGALGVFLENAKTRVFEMINASEGLNAEGRMLWETIRQLGAAFNLDLQVPMDLVTQSIGVLLGFVQETVRRVRLLTSAWLNFKDAIDNGSISSAAAGMRDFQEASTSWVNNFSNSMDNATRIIQDFRANTAEARRDVETSFTLPPVRRSGGSRSNEPTDAERLAELREELGLTVSEIDQRILDSLIGDGIFTEESTLQQIARLERVRDAGEEHITGFTGLIDDLSDGFGALNLETDMWLEGLAEAQAAQDALKQKQISSQNETARVLQMQQNIKNLILEGSLTELDVQRQLIGLQSERNEQMRTYNGLLDVARERTEAWDKTNNEVSAGFDTLKPLITESFRLILEGTENAGDAFVALLDAFLANFAIEQGFLAAKEFVLAIADAASLNAAGAALHAAAGAGHLALAVAAGGAAAAIPNPGAAGAGAAGQNRDQNRDSGGQQPGQTIINIQGQSLLTEANLGRSVRRALEAEQRRF